MGGLGKPLIGAGVLSLHAGRLLGAVDVESLDPDDVATGGAEARDEDSEVLNQWDIRLVGAREIAICVHEFILEVNEDKSTACTLGVVGDV